MTSPNVYFSHLPSESAPSALYRHHSAVPSDVSFSVPSQVMTFHNVSYSVDMPADMRTTVGAEKGAKLQLLHSVSGAFRPGVLTALMGVSGAGKTTLMDVLAGRKTGKQGPSITDLGLAV